MFALCLESSHARGMGHLFRGLTLLDGLRARGHAPLLLMNDHRPSLAVAAARGYEPLIVDVADIQNDWETPIIHAHRIRCWINDRLDTDLLHAERVIRAKATLATFDDSGSGAARATLHVAALKPADTALAGSIVLRGIDYLILNPAIAQHRRARTEHRSTLVTLGGSDTYGVTITVAQRLATAGIAATVVVGPAFEHHERLITIATPNMVIKQGVPCLISEMRQHDLAITGGGVTPFEACATGLPCVVIANEWFEVPNGRLLESLGCAAFAGHYSALDTRLLTQTLPIANMSESGLRQVPLDGLTRVITALENLA